jgi:hypothetical protein
MMKNIQIREAVSGAIRNGLFENTSIYTGTANENDFVFNCAEKQGDLQANLTKPMTQGKEILGFHGLRLVCDECARPLHLYGQNFIEGYTDGRANILRCLCDVHAAELEVIEQ